MRKVLKRRVIALVMAFCMVLSMISTDVMFGALQVQAETVSNVLLLDGEEVS